MRWKHFRNRAIVWTVPSIYAAAAIAAGFLLPPLEHRVWPAAASSLSITSATAIYSTVAAGTIALTAIVFSLTFVMVQFSATAYSPRLVLWVARDPFIAHALGVFSATFLYAIAALAWIDRAGSNLVPRASAFTVMALLVASIGMFIGIIQRIALLQIQRMLTFTGDQGRRVIASLYPRPLAMATDEAVEVLPGTAPTQVLVHHGRPRAVQSIDGAELLRLAAHTHAVIEVAVAVGDTVMESTTLVRVFGGAHVIDEQLLLRTIERGEERTFDQDPKYAIRLLVDIAIRALSPAVNDPTTAVQALDQIGDLLLRLGRRRLEIGTFRDVGGVVRVTVPFPTWDDFLRLAFAEIGAYGATSVQVTRRLHALIGDLVALLPEERRPALHLWLRQLEHSVETHFATPDERAAAWVEDRQGLGVSRRRSAA
jgi:uncharacterized membrane protein